MDTVPPHLTHLVIRRLSPDHLFRLAKHQLAYYDHFRQITATWWWARRIDIDLLVRCPKCCIQIPYWYKNIKSIRSESKATKSKATKSKAKSKATFGYKFNCVLEQAATEGHLDIIRCLVESIDHGDDVTSLIWAAAREGHLSILRYLIEHLGLTIEDVRAKHNCAIILAASKGHLSVTRYLLEKVKLTEQDAFDGTYEGLSEPAIHGNLPLFRYLVCRFNIPKKIIQEYDNHILRLTSFGGHLHVVRYLIEHIGLTAADVLTKDVEDHGEDVLTDAAQGGHLPTFRYLFRRCELTTEDVLKDNGPLDVAICYGHLSMVRYIVEHDIFKGLEWLVLSESIVFAAELRKYTVVRYLINRILV